MLSDSGETLTLQRDALQVLSHLRKESLDLYNRLHSIAEDVQFVKEVCAAYAYLPVLPNLRCGSWYVDPKIARPEPAYFKSTDGHFGNWGFNLRRPNLHLLSVVASKGGLILVDSTRAGKRIPDALSKTVPIWCAVINRAVRRRYLSPDKMEWNTALYCPAGVVSSQEHAQIEARLDGWVDSLTESSYILSDLSRPLRPFWITPSTTSFPDMAPDDNAFYPIICVSASKQIQEGWERRSNGFAYVQGSGDDHELWGMGLTPQLFWEHNDIILNADRAELPKLIQSLLAMSNTRAHNDNWIVNPTPIIYIGGMVSLCAMSDLPSTLPLYLPNSTQPVSFLLISPSTSMSMTDHDGPSATDTQRVLRLQMSNGKKDQIHFLQNILPRSTAFVGTRLEKGERVCICCENGKDASIGVVLAALQLFFDNAGNFVSAKEQQSVLRNTADKQSIAKRLQWIISSRPQANPSRATLKRVNEYILTAPSFRQRRALG